MQTQVVSFCGGGREEEGLDNSVEGGDLGCDRRNTSMYLVHGVGGCTVPHWDEARRLTNVGIRREV